MVAETAFTAAGRAARERVIALVTAFGLATEENADEDFAEVFYDLIDEIVKEGPEAIARAFITFASLVTGLLDHVDIEADPCAILAGIASRLTCEEPLP